MELLISRFDPSREDSLREQTYEITERPDWSVLDALNHIKNDVDPTLTFRWSCRMEICGSCGMMIDGEPRLACSTFLRDLQSPVRVAPLAHFPVIRDLVIEYDGFLDRLRTVKPWIIRVKESAALDGPQRQRPEQLEAFRQFSLCINCMLCYAACPVVAREPEFLGPAALALGHRYALDSRDEGARVRRRDAFLAEGGVFSCSFANECSVVCPKNVDPAAAIQQEKLASVIEWVRSAVDPDPRS